MIWPRGTVGCSSLTLTLASYRWAIKIFVAVGAINMEPLLGPYPLSVTPSPNIALFYEWQNSLLGWPEYLPPRHVGLSWAHPERLQQGIWTCQRAPDSGFYHFFFRESREMKITLSAHFRDGGRVVQTWGGGVCWLNFHLHLLLQHQLLLFDQLLQLLAIPKSWPLGPGPRHLRPSIARPSCS